MPAESAAVDHPFSPDHPANVAGGGRAGEVAVVVRSGVVESRHLGHAVLVGPAGQVVAAVGDPTTMMFPRSAVKPWQAATIRRVGARFRGAPLDGEALAIAAASHAATAHHLDLVAALLEDAGLDVTALQCPPDQPGDEATRIAHNCSGKHAAMLSACVANGWPTGTYLDPAHPMQQAIRIDLEEVVGAAIGHVAVDGCGAPLFAVPLEGLARAAAAFTSGDDHRQAVATAMRAHPDVVAGAGREDTVVMERLDGVIAKVGAEGVQLLATDTGWGVLVKVVDGANRAAMPAALTLLGRAVDIDLGDTLEAACELVLGGGAPVGAVLPGADLLAGS